MKTCLLRVDFNLEKISPNDWRFLAILPTLSFLLKNKTKIIILSHRGRSTTVERTSPQNGAGRHSLKPFVKLLAGKIKQPVVFINHFNFPKIRKFVRNSKNRIFLLENLRFLPGEEKNDKKLARQLASLGDFYVNDAFSVCHRAHASVAAIAGFLPSFAGFRLKKEIETLNRVRQNPKKPLTIILGGAKISEKIGLLKRFWNKTDNILLGGGPANTFFKALDFPVGDSLTEDKAIPLIKTMIKSPKIILPVDTKIKNKKILDIGPETVKQYASIIKKSKTIIWNGPMGLFEQKGFEKGTAGVWQAILANRQAQIVVGGGETLASLATLMPADYKQITADTYPRKSAENQRKFVFLSTGGGAMLACLAGQKLPGLPRMTTRMGILAEALVLLN